MKAAKHSKALQSGFIKKLLRIEAHTGKIKQNNHDDSHGRVGRGTLSVWLDYTSSSSLSQSLFASTVALTSTYAACAGRVGATSM